MSETEAEIMLSDRIRTLRKERKLSQIELAKALNVHQTAVSQWEKNRTNPDTNTLKRLADYFGVSIDYLLEEGSQGKLMQPAASDGAYPHLSEDGYREYIDPRNVRFALMSETENMTGDMLEELLAIARIVKKRGHTGR